MGQVAHGLVLRIRYPDQRQLTGPMQAGECRRVPPVGLDPLTRLARDQARRHHHTVVAMVAEMPVDPIATRTGLVDEAQGPTAPAEPGQQLVERHRRIGGNRCLAPTLRYGFLMVRCRGRCRDGVADGDGGGGCERSYEKSYERA